MNNNRLGCLPPSAIIASIVTLLIVAGFAFTSGNGLFTAGSLNARTGKNIGGVTSHTEIGNDCAKCHSAPWEADTLGDRCQACHIGISAQLTDPTTLHGVMLKNQSITCQTCHPDHRGPTAAMTDMQPGSFLHDKTGYSLNSHPRRSDRQAFTCSDCHGNDITRFDPQTCITCHQQMDIVFVTAHTLAYGTDCRDCHDGIETIGKNFDHNRAVFKLEGKHVGLVCTKCHLDAHTAADFKSTPANCDACHQKDDKHNGKFGQDCAACHNNSNWNEATFDHNLSAFKLDGAHVNVVCEKCHINNVFKGTPIECSGCHQDPIFHLGMFPGQACSTCHTASAWRPARYNGSHTFPMNHGEKNNLCADCHQPTLTQWTCYTCHEQGKVDRKHQKEGISDFADCLRCHSTGRKEEGEGHD